jgi:hypothetical protein
LSPPAPGSAPSPVSPRPGRGGLRLRIAATAGVVALAGLSSARHASASFDERSIPIGDVASADGIVAGTVRLSGDRLVFYSGDRFRSNESSLAVNFASGGSLVLCPHSQVQILAASQNSGVMLAFAEGGSEQAFPVHPNDVVITPDWRIEMTGDIHPGDLGELQISTTRHGDLCLSGAVQTGEYFRISQLIGDASFNFPAEGSVRIANGTMETYPAGCSCDNTWSATEARPPQPPTTSPVSPSPLPNAVPSVSPVTQHPEASVSETKKKQRPQDVAGYLRSFIHVVFGR